MDNEAISFAKLCGGDDGYQLSQIASFLGGILDNANINATARAVGEDYYKILLGLAEENRAVLAKATK